MSKITGHYLTQYAFIEDALVTPVYMGGKAYHVYQMMRLGVAAPPFVLIPTTGFSAFDSEPQAAMEGVELSVGKWRSWLSQYSLEHHYPLMSVRSGAPISMPGMMDTVLNVGMNDEALPHWAGRIGAWGAVDCYRRLVQMYGTTVKGIKAEVFEHILTAHRSSDGAKSDADLSLEGLCAVLDDFRAAYEGEAGEPFPQDPEEQMVECVRAVWQSWNSPRAIEYRSHHGIDGSLGTAVMIQGMIFGNADDNSCSGVVFTRDPTTGEPGAVGEYLVQAQGEDVVSGVRTPDSLEDFTEDFGSGLADHLEATCQKLEAHFGDMLDIEFTIQEGDLWVLQCRPGKRTREAAIRIAHDLAAEGKISTKQALARLTREDATKTGTRVSAQKPALVTGLGASPGAACGRVVYSSERAKEMAKEGPVILVRPETNPDDVGGMLASAGVLTKNGGVTSHAAVVARALNKPAVVGCDSIGFAMHGEHLGLAVKGYFVPEGEWMTIDGSTGEAWIGQQPIVKVEPSKYLTALLLDRAWHQGLPVRVADPEMLASVSFPWVVVCRPEHPGKWATAMYKGLLEKAPKCVVIDLRYEANAVIDALSVLTNDVSSLTARNLAKLAKSLSKDHGLNVQVVRSGIPEVDEHVDGLPEVSNVVAARSIHDYLMGRTADDFFINNVVGGKALWETLRAALSVAGHDPVKSVEEGLGLSGLATRLIEADGSS